MVTGQQRIGKHDAVCIGASQPGAFPGHLKPLSLVGTGNDFKMLYVRGHGGVQDHPLKIAVGQPLDVHAHCLDTGLGVKVESDPILIIAHDAIDFLMFEDRLPINRQP